MFQKDYIVFCTEEFGATVSALRCSREVGDLVNARGMSVDGKSIPFNARVARSTGTTEADAIKNALDIGFGSDLHVSKPN